jgi:hypothetical protein
MVNSLGLFRKASDSPFVANINRLGEKAEPGREPAVVR